MNNIIIFQFKKVSVYGIFKLITSIQYESTNFIYQ